MKKKLVHSVFAVFLVAWITTSSLGAVPNYWILRPAATSKNFFGRRHGYHPGQPVMLPATGYAYGWFGVRSRQHRIKSHGWRGNYTQWKYR